MEFKKDRCFNSFFTGGDFYINSSGSTLFTTCTNIVKAIDVMTGVERFSIGHSEDADVKVASFVLTPDESKIIIAHVNDIIRIYDLSDSSTTLLCQFRGTHKATINIMRILISNSSGVKSLILATGSSDFYVKIWNLDGNFCTHNLQGKSVVTALTFIDEERLIVGYAEGNIRLFNLVTKSKKKIHLECSHHSSHITSIVTFLSDEKHLIAAFSRDQTFSIINPLNMQVKIFSLNCWIAEACVFFENFGHENQFLLFGSDGLLKIWSLSKNKELATFSLARSNIDSVSHCPSNSMVVCSSECNLLFFDTNLHRIIKQFIGYYGEIFAAHMISNKTNCLALATNSPDLLILDLKLSHNYFATGHSQSILTIDSPNWSDNLLASGSKDNSIIIWFLKNEIKMEDQMMSDNFVKKIASATGHTNSVTSLRFSHSPNKPFIVSGSVDMTLKIWSLSEVISHSIDELFKMSAISTMLAHEKDINSVDISQNDKLILTASMDKTVKLWHVHKDMHISLAETFGGHKRGVWCARFSRSSNMIATCSGDCTVKLFSLLDKSCIRTLESHSFAILSILFIKSSEELLSVDAGGMIKVWDIKKGICKKTFEGHSDKIWSVESLPIMGDDGSSFITASADGQIVFWKDVTEEVELEKSKYHTRMITEQQAMSNFLHQGKYLDALVLSIDLAQPFQCLKILRKLLGSSSEFEESINVDLASLLIQLNPIQLSTLLEYATRWNSNTRTSRIAQILLNCVLNSIPPEQILDISGVDSVVKAFIPYTQRHYERLSNLRKNISHLNYTYSCMRLT